MEKDLFENSYSNLEYETQSNLSFMILFSTCISQRFENQLKKAT
jgi:hypothetical protein